MQKLIILAGRPSRLAGFPRTSSTTASVDLFLRWSLSAGLADTASPHADKEIVNKINETLGRGYPVPSAKKIKKAFESLQQEVKNLDEKL